MIDLRYKRFLCARVIACCVSGATCASASQRGRDGRGGDGGDRQHPQCDFQIVFHLLTFRLLADYRRLMVVLASHGILFRDFCIFVGPKNQPPISPQSNPARPTYLGCHVRGLICGGCPSLVSQSPTTLEMGFHTPLLPCCWSAMSMKFLKKSPIRMKGPPNCS